MIESEEYLLMKKIIDILALIVFCILACCFCYAESLDAIIQSELLTESEHYKIISNEPNMGYDIAFKCRGASSRTMHYYLLDYDRKVVTEYYNKYKRGSGKYNGTNSIATNVITKINDSEWGMYYAGEIRRYFDIPTVSGVATVMIYGYNHKYPEECTLVDIEEGVKYLKKGLYKDTRAALLPKIQFIREE